jgi:prepilin-type N-terminal cleavage/methylation domain-containing protein
MRGAAAFTLVEMIAAIVVMSVVAAVVLPTVSAASDQMAAANAERLAAEEAAFAADRVARELREIPLNTATAALALTDAQADRIVWSNPRGVPAGEFVSGIDLDTGAIVLLDGAGNARVLIDEVTAFEIRYVDESGVQVTDAATRAQRTHHFEVRLVARGVEYRVTAFPRVLVGGG